MTGQRPSFSRRLMVGGGLAAAAAPLARPFSAHAGSLATAPRRIDMHHHLPPPRVLERLYPADCPQGMSAVWSPRRAIEDMDRAGIALSMLSITPPALKHADVGAARDIARACNEHAAQLASHRIDRLGFFLALPLPDVDGALAEIAYGLDVLGAAGVTLATGYEDSWLGHLRFAPVFADLDRRKAVVVVHPASADDCRDHIGCGTTHVEFGDEVTKALADVVFSGIAQRYRDITFVFAHAGDAMPVLAERFISSPPTERAEAEPAASGDIVPADVQAALSRFFYDAPRSTPRASLAAFSKFIPVSQLLLGSTYGARTGVGITAEPAGHGFTATDLDAVAWGNAARVLGRTGSA